MIYYIITFFNNISLKFYGDYPGRDAFLWWTCLSPVETEATSFFFLLALMLKTSMGVLGFNLGELVVEDVKPCLFHVLLVDVEAALHGEGILLDWVLKPTQPPLGSS